tara:strand:+ start:367 stop:777 length:411 start_codon:yes stop_codon:yes gene_type:complete
MISESWRRINKYAGDCVFCHNTVPAGFGYYNGCTTCADLVEVEDGYGLVEVTCKNAEGALMNYFASKKYVAQKEAMKAHRKEVGLHLEKMRNENIATNKELKAEGKCTRCGGAGRSDNWIATGSICFKCDGTGKAK